MATTQYIQDFLDNLGYYRDRTVDTVLELPYDLDDVKIKPNDLVLADAFNTSISRLYHNMLYLISNSGFANNMTPQISWEMRNVYKSIRERNFWTLQWPSPGDEYKHNTDYVIDMLTVRSKYIDTNSQENLQYLCNVIAEKNKDGTSSITLISNDHDCHKTGPYSVLNQGLYGDLPPGVWSSNIVDDERREFKFSNIKSICVDSSSKLYVLDDNIIYQYNIDGVLNRDLSLLRENMRIGRKLTNTLGVDLNTGGKTNKFGFENPKKILTQHVDGEEFLYVVDDDVLNEDTTNLAVKKYDLSMNWVKTYIIDDYSKSGSSEHNIADIIPYDNFSSGEGFIAVTTDHHFITYDSEFNVINEYDGGSTDIPKKLHTSKENPNILYVQIQEEVDSNGVVLNPGSIQKRYVSNLPSSFAEFEDLLVCSSFGLEFLRVPIYSDVSGNDDKGWEPWAMRCINVVADEITGMDIIYISYSTNTNGSITWNFGQDERIVCIAEGENSIHNLFVDYESDLYELEDIYIDKEEFVNSQIYNKTIAKIIHNMMSLDSNVKGKFEQYRLNDVDKSNYNINTTTVLNGLVYRNEFEVSQLPECNNDLSTYIGVNEIVSSAVLNRCITKIYCWLNRLMYKIDLYDGDELSRKFLLDGEMITCEPVIPPTPSPTVTPTVTPTQTVTPTVTPTQTVTPTPTVTPSVSTECSDGISDDLDRGLITDDGRCIEPDLEPTPTPTTTVTPTATTTPPSTPTVTPTITPSTSRIVAPETMLMLVKAGDWEHVSWEGDYISSTSGPSNDNGEFIIPTIQQTSDGVNVKLTSNAGDWNWEMQRIEMEITRRWVSYYLPGQWQWIFHKPSVFGDIKNFITHDNVTGTLNSGNSVNFDIKVAAAGENGDTHGLPNPKKPQDFIDTEKACRIDAAGWSEIKWPPQPIQGVESLTPRESGRQGCVSPFVDIGRFYVQSPGDIGTRSILCFKFTRN